MKLIDESIQQYLEGKLTNERTEDQKHIDLFYLSQMCSNYKMEEKQLRDIIQRNLAPSDNNTKIKLHIYYRNEKLKNLIVHNRFHKATEQFGVDTSTHATEENVILPKSILGIQRAPSPNA